MANILQLNEISPIAYSALTDGYSIGKDATDPIGIILRSFNMHEYQLPSSLLCVGRAGAGVNNIPLDKCSANGVVVFNSPGANANAVKELIICSLLLASRKIFDGINWSNSLKGKDDVAKLVEKGKGSFVGGEILGKKLGVVGLGAIGALVANACVDLGMTVIGYDPYISVDNAWNLNHNIVKQNDLNALLRECDYITMHIPLLPTTSNMINEESIALMKDGVSIINCSRGELVNDADIIAAVNSGKVSRYVTDFPNDNLLNVKNIIPIPHLGASTPEAEDNCAYMVTRQMIDFLENGNIVNSVNFPNCVVPRYGKCRITIIHNNVKNVLNSITDKISKAGYNIGNMVSQSKGSYAYAILDLDEEIDESTFAQIKLLPEITKIRLICR